MRLPISGSGRRSACGRRCSELREDGVFRKIGISAYVADDPARLAARFRPDVMQLPFSLLDQRLLADGTLARLAELGVEVHARSLFLQGLLFLETSAGKIARTPRRIWRTCGSNCGKRARRRWRRRWALCCRGRRSLSAWWASPLRRNWRKSWPRRRQPLPDLDWAACALEDETDAYAVALVSAPTTRRTSACVIAGNMGKVRICATPASATGHRPGL